MSVPKRVKKSWISKIYQFTEFMFLIHFHLSTFWILHFICTPGGKWNRKSARRYLFLRRAADLKRATWELSLCKWSERWEGGTMFDKYEQNIALHGCESTSFGTPYKVASCVHCVLAGKPQQMSVTQQWMDVGLVCGICVKRLHS